MTPLGIINFVAVQWFGLRIAKQTGCGGTSWHLLRWVWPLTGWWSSYIWIKRTWPPPRRFRDEIEEVNKSINAALRRKEARDGDEIAEED